ncbi:MAG: hypothetical protein PHV17_03975 [Candidatus Omnitrophica bacterium]|nr:hypothetical protein [Candidatus Omnitrophota bacterium]
MEITRVRLNPEQAVLSCCDSSSKLEAGTAGQCDWTPVCDPEGTAPSSPSS